MSKRSRIMVALIACGFMAVSARAALDIISNPHNMLITYYEVSTGNWWNWETDTLQTAYEAGQVTISTNFNGSYVGTPDQIVDGLTGDYEIVGYECYKGSTVDFKFESSYTGGRTIGATDNQAMRVKINYHQSHNGFHYRLEYSTTADPTVFQTLVEVADFDSDLNWLPKMMTYEFDENSSLVNGVDTIRYIQLDESHQGLIEEINITLVPGDSPGKKSLFAAAPDMGWTGTTGTVDWTVGSYITVGEAPLSVTALGYVDHGADGLADSHAVGIYDASQVLIASETVAAGAVDLLANGWRYVELAVPVELAANSTYLIVGDTGDGVDPFRYVPETDDDEPIPATGSGVDVPDLDGDGIGYGGTNAVGDLARVYAPSGGASLTYPTIVRDGVWNAVNMQYDILPAQATIVGWSFTNNMVRLVLDAPSADESFLKTTADLVTGAWGNVAHSDNGVNPLYITNLTYSTVEGGNKVIYVDANATQGFFGVGRAE